MSVVKIYQNPDKHKIMVEANCVQYWIYMKDEWFIKRFRGSIEPMRIIELSTIEHLERSWIKLTPKQVNNLKVQLL